MPAVTWDPVTAAFVTLSGGNLVVTSGAGTAGARSADAAGKTSGKHYFEVTVTTEGGGGNTGLGVGTTTSTYANMGNNATSGGLVYLNGGIYANSVNTGMAIGDPGNGHVIGIAVNLDVRKIWFRNLSIADQTSGFGGWNGIADIGGLQNPATGAGGLTLPAGSIVPFCTFNAAGNVFTANFGASAFMAPVPTGYAAGWLVGGDGGGEPVTGSGGLAGTGAMGAYWAQADDDNRGYESSRKRRKRFLEDRARRIREL